MLWDSTSESSKEKKKKWLSRAFVAIMFLCGAWSLPALVKHRRYQPEHIDADFNEIAVEDHEREKRELSASQRFQHPITSTRLQCNWTRNGCFEDIGESLLQGAIAGGGGLTQSKCFAFCEKKGYLLAGLQRGIRCYCASCISGSLGVSRDKECSKPCHVDEFGEQKSCGGTSHLELFVCSKTGSPTLEPSASLCLKNESNQNIAESSSATATNFPEEGVTVHFRNSTQTPLLSNLTLLSSNNTFNGSVTALNNSSLNTTSPRNSTVHGVVFANLTTTSSDASSQSTKAPNGLSLRSAVATGNTSDRDSNTTKSEPATGFTFRFGPASKAAATSVAPSGTSPSSSHASVSVSETTESPTVISSAVAGSHVPSLVEKSPQLSSGRSQSPVSINDNGIASKNEDSFQAFENTFHPSESSAEKNSASKGSFGLSRLLKVDPNDQSLIAGFDFIVVPPSNPGQKPSKTVAGSVPDKNSKNTGKIKDSSESPLWVPAKFPGGFGSVAELISAHTPTRQPNSSVNSTVEALDHVSNNQSLIQAANISASNTSSDNGNSVVVRSTPKTTPSPSDTTDIDEETHSSSSSSVVTSSHTTNDFRRTNGSDGGSISAILAPGFAGKCDWRAQGCKEDQQNPNRLLRARRDDFVGGSDMTIDLCQRYCESKGHRIAGLEYGFICFCGDCFSSEPKESLKCSTSCIGDFSENCGGKLAINVFTCAIAGVEPTVGGCIKGNLSRSFEFE